MRPSHWLILLSAALLSGCATHAVDKSYGNAYQQTLNEQIYNPATRGTTPRDKALEGLDPEQAQMALEQLRGDTAQRAAVKPAPFINIQQSSGGGEGSQ
ncbi:MAG: hypothetical protein ACHQDB_03175 [Steroidobacterales bacterium]